MAALSSGCINRYIVCELSPTPITHDNLIKAAAAASKILSYNVASDSKFELEAKEVGHIDSAAARGYAGFYDYFGKGVWVRKGFDATDQTALHEMVHAIRFEYFRHKEYGSLPYEFYNQSILRDEECIADMGLRYYWRPRARALTSGHFTSSAMVMMKKT